MHIYLLNPYMGWARAPGPGPLRGDLWIYLLYGGFQLYAYHVKLRKAYEKLVFTRKATAKSWCVCSRVLGSPVCITR